jgi:hypothetical protein
MNHYKKITKSLAVISVSVVLMVSYSNCSGQHSDQSEFASESAALVDENSQKLSVCKPPTGVSGSPKTFENVVRLINALPKPLTLPCFLESLDRPLSIHATLGASSAQPSTGPDNPRIFIFEGNLSLSVVADGPGRNYVELGLLVSNTDSKKGELQFPIDKNIDFAEPYNHLRNPLGSGTNCVLCHTNEIVDSSVTFAKAYTSKAIKPSSFAKMPINEVKDLNKNCSLDSTDFRCVFLNSILNNGEILDGDFPENMAD